MTEYRPRDVIDVPVWSAVVVIMAVPVVAPDEHVGVGSSTHRAASCHIVTILVNSGRRYMHEMKFLPERNVI